MIHQQQNPAQASSKASGKNKPTGRKTMSKEAMQNQALNNAVTNESTANYEAIFQGFFAMGIEPEAIEPRKNVFTFNAWKALGRVVKRGERGVKIVTIIPCTKKDKETGEEVAVKKTKTTTVFHISQTQPIDGPTDDTPTDDQTTKIENAALEPVEPSATVEEDQERPLNHYERRQQERRERYEARAEKAQNEAARKHAQAHDMASVIPFGQPILVGHHSEQRDRNYRAKIHNTFGQAFALQEKAEHYESKARTVGTGGISSDDPDAIKKLQEQLNSAEKSQEAMKQANRIIRQRSGDEDAQIDGILAIGCFTNAQAKEIVTPDFMGRVGFPGYALTNNNANIRRIRERIASLEKQAQRQSVEKKGEGFIYREDTDENRVMFIFDGKPDDETRQVLKKNGFRFSPSREGKPWVRQLNNAGIYAARSVVSSLNLCIIGDD